MSVDGGNGAGGGSDHNQTCSVCQLEEPTEQMIQCKRCNGWWHNGCIGDEVSIDPGLWMCQKCSEESASEFQDVMNEAELVIAEEEAVINRKLELIRLENELLEQKSQLFERKRLSQAAKDTAGIGNTFIHDESGQSETGQPNATKGPRAQSTRLPATTRITVTPNTRRLFTDPPTGLQPSEPQLNDSHIETDISLVTQQLAARQTTPRDLPEFHGHPGEWPIFYSSYKESTDLCRFSHAENLLRLQKSLKGKARSLVQAQLNLPSCVPDIVETLQMTYGRPEYILDEQLKFIRSIPALKSDKLESIVSYSSAVRNLNAVLSDRDLVEHCYNPMLIRELVDKLPPSLKVEWAINREKLMEDPEMVMNVKHFSDWLHVYARRICTVTNVYQDGPSNSKQKGTKFTGIHAESAGENGNKTCGLCKEKRHENLADCKKFSGLGMKSRWEYVKKIRVCRVCLKHHKPYCELNKNVCGIDGCKDSHHALLHKTKEANETDSTKKLHAAHVTEQKILCRIIPVMIHGPKKQIKTYALLDSGSTVTMVDDKIMKELQIVGQPDPLHLQWTAGTTRVENESQRVELLISGENNNNKTYTLHARTVKNIGLPTQSLDVEDLQQKYNYLSGLPIKSYKEVKPLIIIGLDNCRLVISSKTREGRENEPVASKCRLGWTIEGPINGDTNFPGNKKFTCSLHICECKSDNEKIHEMLKSYFEFDKLRSDMDVDSYSMEDRRNEKILKETVRLIGNRRYEAGLLWKFDNFTLPDTRPMAMKRLQCLEKKLKQDPSLREEMNRKVQAYITKGYARKLTADEIKHPPELVAYQPVFPVTNPNKPGKIRMVFDAAAKVNGISLNDMLSKGLDLTASLFGVLVRFRLKNVAITGDAEEMFHQVRVRPQDQHVQRFVYRFSEKDEINEYVLEVLPFGAACSPCIAQYVKLLTADLNKEKYPQASLAIKLNSYVDDVLDGADDESSAIMLAKDIKFVFAEGGFNVRNWRSNSRTVQETLEPGSINDHNLDLSGVANIEKVLGMFWNTNNDCFQYTFKFNKGSEDILAGQRLATKRELLKILMSLYDPLGLLTNYLIQLKLLIQDLWRTGSGWDDPVTEQQQKTFNEWISHVPEVEALRIPRCYFSKVPDWNDTNIQLHMFVDAGENAYASTGYLRIANADEVECKLISAKAKVAPIKFVSIPRLELEAARLGARHAKVIADAMMIKIHKIFYWTDNNAVLAWLRSDSRSNPAFIAHRVAEIQDLTDIANWRWVPTGKNVADEASKKKESYTIKSDSRWYNGPDFLRLPEEQWPKEKVRQKQEANLHVQLFAKHSIVKPECIVDVKKFSSWWKLLRSVAWVIRYRNVLRAKINGVAYQAKHLLTPDELADAENLICLTAQHDSYPNEMSALANNLSIVPNSKIASMNPFIDAKGVLRSNSRLVECEEVAEYVKRPIILAKDHWVSTLIIRHYHERFLHRNHETVVNEIKQRYWIPKLRVALKKVRASCAECRIISAKPEPPQMAPLPMARLDMMVRPFTHAGVDYFGPIPVTLGRNKINRYGVLFTCMVTRAVYLHVAHSLSTSSFIQAFQTFMSRRGRPRFIYCDNGTNFIGAERELRKELQAIDNLQIAEKFVNADLEWKFNPPSSPHFGGAWERLVRSVKTSLYACLPKSRMLNDETLVATMALVENIINSRPLTYLPLDHEGEALTPNHWLMGSTNGIKPQTPLINDPNILVNSWKRAEEISQRFWKRWLTEYLPTLTRRLKWMAPVKPIEKNDIVIVIDEKLPRNSWPKAKVLEVITAKDGQVRQAVIQTSNGIYKRPVVKLAKLDLSSSTTE